MVPGVRAAIVVAALGGLGVACTPTQPALGRVERPVAEHVEPYTRLFDDSFSAAALGAQEIRRPGDVSQAVSELAAKADAIVRVRINSVSEYNIDERRGFLLSVDVIEPLAGRFDQVQLELPVDEANLGAPALFAPERLLGETLLVFVRVYAGVDEPVVHFRVEADNESTVESANAGRLGFD